MYLRSILDYITGYACICMYVCIKTIYIVTPYYIYIAYVYIIPTIVYSYINISIYKFDSQEAFIKIDCTNFQN